MATGTNIRTYFQGAWHDGNIAIMNAADHGAWLGSSVFDGARYAHGVAPDLMAHCERVNRSARALMLEPSHSAAQIHDLIWQGIRLYAPDTPLYIRPMYWGIDGERSAIVPKSDPVGFCICLEEIPLAAPDATARLTTTRFHRPVLADSVINAKAGCLYPNNARMLVEARSKGYDNALVADALGNVAETATANIFLVKDGVVRTPIANGTFLSGITRARHIINLREAGRDVREETLGFDDFHAADEVFMSGNMTKVTPVTEFDGTHYPVGPVTRQALQLYWDWAKSGT